MNKIYEIPFPENDLIKTLIEQRKHAFKLSSGAEAILKDNLSFRTPASMKPVTAKIIKCEKGLLKNVLDEIDSRGYAPLPSPYLLKLCTQNPNIIAEYGYLTSLDKNNYFTNIKSSRRNSSEQHNGFLRFMQFAWPDVYFTSGEGIINERWWYAVINKSMQLELFNES